MTKMLAQNLMKTCESDKTRTNPAGIYLLKVDNSNTRIRYEYVQS